MSRKKTIEEIFIANSKASRKIARNFILSKKLIEYKCKVCGNLGMWQDKMLTLQLEHKNGIPNDHRLENLEFLCPNCHTQTDTYGGKSSRKNYHSNKKELERIAKIQKDDLIKRKIENIISDLSEVNFSEYGWVNAASTKVGISPQKIRAWISKHAPHFLEHAYSRKTFR